MRKKDILAYGLNAFFSESIFSNCRRLLPEKLMILAYHRVKDLNKNQVYSYDKELISASIMQFDYQMAYIKKHFYPINEEQLVNHIVNGEMLPTNSIMVTFDDGFDDNYYNAFPILQKHSVPATMFISTGYIGKKEPIWFDWVASLFISGTMKEIDIPALRKKYIKGSHQNNCKNFDDAIRKIRKIPNTQRLEMLDQLHADYSHYMSHINTKDSRMLNWSQIIELSNNNISIGSHTVTHPIMSRLTDSEIIYELSESKRQIESHISKTITSLSYPTGQLSSFTDTVIKESINLGYKTAHTYIHGTNLLPIVNTHKLERIHVERYIHNKYFNVMLMFPHIFRD